MRVLVITGSNRIRGVSVLKGTGNDASFFMSLAPLLAKSGVIVTAQHTKPIPDNTDILVFSGHGGIINGNMVLIAPSKYLRSISSVTSNDLISSNDVPTTCNVIVDACYAGAFKNGTPLKFVKGLSLEKSGVVLDKQRPFDHSGIRSSDENSLSYEININGHNHGSMIYALESCLKLIKLKTLKYDNTLNVVNDMNNLLKANNVNQDLSFIDNGDDKITQFLKIMVDLL